MTRQCTDASGKILTDVAKLDTAGITDGTESSEGKGRRRGLRRRQRAAVLVSGGSRWRAVTLAVWITRNVSYDVRWHARPATAVRRQPGARPEGDEQRPCGGRRASYRLGRHLPAHEVVIMDKEGDVREARGYYKLGFTR
jgi:hypothetical protein